MAELNAAIAELVEQLNDRPMRSLGTTRRALFEQVASTAEAPSPLHEHIRGPGYYH